jgi:hypothetical protein
MGLGDTRGRQGDRAPECIEQSESVEIVIDHDRKLIMLAGKDSLTEIKGDKIRIKGRG